jgi:hypothetical protein
MMKELKKVQKSVSGIGRASAIKSGNDKKVRDHGANGKRRLISTSFATR